MSGNISAVSKELSQSLERLLALHHALLGLLDEEYAHMSALDVKSLGECGRAKESILAEIVTEEQNRARVAEALGGALGLSAGHNTISALAAALHPQEGKALQKAGTALRLSVERAKELNGRNMAFAEGSLSRIEEMKRNVLGLTNTATKENYSQSGTRQPLPEQGGRLLSTEA